MNDPVAEEPGRHSIRLMGYDYSAAGGYFVTLVTHGRECLFGEVIDEDIQINALGRILQAEWFRSASIRKEIHLSENEFVVMPNHIHGIVWIETHFVGADGVRPDDETDANLRGTHRVPLQDARYIPPHLKPRSLGSFIAGFKASVTHRAGRELTSRAGIQPASAVSGSREPNTSGNIWQRNYYEHILRNQADYERIAGYIHDNPLNWNQDDENPQNTLGKENASARD